MRYKLPLIAGLFVYGTSLSSGQAVVPSGSKEVAVDRELRPVTKGVSKEIVPVHHVPFGSSGNRIDLTLLTDSPPIGNIHVKSIDPPKWIHISPATQQVTDAQQNKEQTATFAFSVEKIAPVNTEQELAFLVSTNRGEQRKIIRIVIDLPNQFELFQNYPNPFNPVTVVSYTLPEKSPVTVKVYDVLGREVETLVDEAQEPGYKTVNFDATNLASGVYFCRLVAGEFVAVRKLVVMK